MMEQSKVMDEKGEDVAKDHQEQAPASKEGTRRDTGDSPVEGVL